MSALRRVCIVALACGAVRCTCGPSGGASPDCSTYEEHPHGHYELESGCYGGGTCAFKCDSNFVDCNNDESDGCETSAIGAAPHTRITTSPTCKTVCSYGWLDCDSNMTNGCEKLGSSCSEGSDADGAVVSTCMSGVDAAAIAWKPPSTPTLSCTPTQINDLANACFGPGATQAACDAWSAANAPCYACMVSDISAATAGPLITVDGWFQINVGGCEALVSSDSSPTGCGAKQQIASVCEMVACTTCDGYTANDCFDAADTTICSAYVGALCKEPDAGAVHDACLKWNTFADGAVSLGILFCSATPSDAGDDASSDAALD